MLLRSAKGAPPAVAADTSLPAPQTESERNYLGLSSTSERFSLDDVRADILFVDFFDMYCHVCQMRAPHMNDFYKLVQSRGLSSRVRMIGVGVGDTLKEVTVFKEKFKLPFPVFPDRTGSFTKQFGKIKVPNLIVLKKRSGHFEIVYQDSSLPENPDGLLSKLISDSGRRISAPAPEVHVENVKCPGGKTSCPIVLSAQPVVGDKANMDPPEQKHREASK
jgi:peroxiredoxin